MVEYLGYNPFTDPALGGPKGNETPYVAVLVPEQSFDSWATNQETLLGIAENPEAMRQRTGGERQNSLGMGDRPVSSMCHSQ